MKEGIILKGIGGFYYVQTEDNKIIECKARGKFRNKKISPVVGDRVKVESIEAENGVIDEILDRKNLLLRPLVSNVDQAVVVFAAKKPDIVYSLLDRLLILIEHFNINTIICINKIDIDDCHKFEYIKDIYEKAGYRVIKTSGTLGIGIDELKSCLKGKVSVFAGPSGVGKSTLFNKIQDKVEMETGNISEKIKRGKNTTRHAELTKINTDTYAADTPGFSNIDLSFMEPYDLQYKFKEFSDYINKCKFTSCIHYKEDFCAIKDAVGEGLISKERYSAYVEILKELQGKKGMKK